MDAPSTKQPTFMDLSAEELISRSICPVKKEHVRIRSGDGRGEAPPAPPSHRAQRKEHKEGKKRKANLCNAFQLGTCTYGDSCKFSHDYASFVADLQPDLPGLCPFEARSDDPCPYGIACRWAVRHRASPPAFLAALAAKTPQARSPGAETEGSAAFSPASLVICGEVIAAPDASIPPVEQRPVSLYAEATPTRTPVAVLKAELNDAREAKEKLQRNRYDLTKSVAFLEAMGVKVKYKGKQQGGANPAGPAAPAPAPVPPKEEKAAATAEEAKEEEENVAKRVKVEGGGAVPVEGSALTEGAKGSVLVVAAGEPDVYRETPLKPEEKKRMDFAGKTYLAPLTTNGNLPFRRLAVSLGCDITCSEMAMATNLLQGHRSEFALLKRHPSEKFFGIQVCGGFPDAMGQTAQILAESIECDFVDINSGCPIDLVCNKGGGSALLRNPTRVESICRAMSGLLTCPLTLKIRKGYELNHDTVHTWLPKVHEWGVSAVTLHGRTREQRYSKLADWDYIRTCGGLTSVPLIGNGDIFSFEEYNEHMASGGLATCMIGRGGLIKPWLFTEIKEQRHWDISATERLDLYKDFCRYGLDHWGSDSKGIETTRRFLLEMMSFTHRYVPVGLLDTALFQRMNWRPPSLYGRNQLETWLSSERSQDWVQLSELLLGPAPDGFHFAPKHKSNAYSVGEKETVPLTAAAAAFEGEENG